MEDIRERIKRVIKKWHIKNVYNILLLEPIYTKEEVEWLKIFLEKKEK